MNGEAVKSETGTLQSTSVPDDGLGDLLRELVGGWRKARTELGLPTTASFADVAKRVNVDRGTAQRLTRLGRLLEVGPADLAQFPGARAWHRVLAGVQQELGARHPAAVGLGTACDRFAEYLAQSGGRSAAVRHLTAGNGNGHSGGPVAPSDPQAARARWVDAAAESMGYLVDVRWDVQFVRESLAVADGLPRQLDVAFLNVLHHCRGRPGAMPLAFTRYARTPAFPGTVPSDTAATLPRPFHLLRAGTTRPAPVVLTTGDANRQTLFVEPQWTSLADPLDLALLQGDPTPFPSPWGTGIECLEFACINRHPCRRLVLDRFVSREKAATFIPSVGAFRSHGTLSHDEPWFDRLPQEGTIRRVGTPADAMADEPFPGYAAILAEAVAHLGWSPDDLVVYRAVIENPIPLATYTIMFDRVQP